AQLPHRGLGLSRLQARARGQYDSHAHPPPRARARVTGGAGESERHAAGGRGEGAGARPRHVGAGAPLHGLARGSGGLMQHFLGQMIEMFRLELFLQLSLATLFGGAIGLERELGGKPAGLRTNILICIGSVLYTKLSITMASGNSDPTRVAAQIVTGVGFIGAGTILHARGAVVGLTSAATIWVVAAIGVALGAAVYWEAAGTTLLVLIVLRGLGRVERLVARASTQSTLLVHAHPEPTALDELETVVRRTGGGGLSRVRCAVGSGGCGAGNPALGPYLHRRRRGEPAAHRRDRDRAHEQRRRARRADRRLGDRRPRLFRARPRPDARVPGG